MSVQADDRRTLTFLLDHVVYQLDRQTGVCTRETRAGRQGDEQFEPLLVDLVSKGLVVSKPLLIGARRQKITVPSQYRCI